MVCYQGVTMIKAALGKPRYIHLTMAPNLGSVVKSVVKSSSYPDFMRGRDGVPIPSFRPCIALFSSAIAVKLRESLTTLLSTLGTHLSAYRVRLEGGLS